MPLLKPRPAPNDGGYAVMDYRAVDPRLGTTDDLRATADVLRGAGISLVLDLVCNHTAREHEWAEKARAGDPTYLAYYRTYPDRTEPDDWERSLPEVFPDFAPGNFTWDPACERWVWTTFNDYQWDLDYTNPDVFAEMFAVICHLANVGVEVLRLDAVAFMWKRKGTNCQNQPEVHLLLQAWRALSRIVAPAVILLAEAIVSPDDLVGYLGRGEGAGKECELAYHNVLMVSLWSALAEQNAALLTHTLRAMPPIPPSAAWLTYVRLHDDIGWAVTDENAGAVGLGGYDHRAFLSDFYSGEFPGSFARGAVFQANPATGDRRISGSLASLAGLEEALERGDDEAAALAVRRILLLNHLILTFGGVPAGLHGRRDRDAQRPGLRPGPRARRRQPVAAPAADGLGGGRAPHRPGQHRGAGLPRAAVAGAAARGHPGAARAGRRRGAVERRPAGVHAAAVQRPRRPAGAGQRLTPRGQHRPAEPLGPRARPGHRRGRRRPGRARGVPGALAPPPLSQRL